MASGPLAQLVEQQPFKLLVLGSSPRRLTKMEMLAELGAALAAPPSADSAAKGYFKSGRSCRKKRTERKNAKINKVNI